MVDFLKIYIFNFDIKFFFSFNLILPGEGGGEGGSAPLLRFLPITQRGTKIIQPNLVTLPENI